MDHFGAEDAQTPRGSVRRFKLFDLDFDGEARDRRVAGQEEVQNAIYRVLGNFVRAGRVNKLILLHGPNGSAKSSIVDGAQARPWRTTRRLPRGRALPLQLDLPHARSW